MVADKTIPRKKEGQGSRFAIEPATLRLITTGRTTGLPHTVIVRFVVSEGAYFVIGGGRKSDWFINALASKGGKVSLGDHVQTVECEQFFDKDFVRGLFTQKYGSRIVKEWYSSSQSSSLKLTPTAPPVTRERLRKMLSVQDMD